MLPARMAKQRHVPCCGRSFSRMASTWLVAPADLAGGSKHGFAAIRNYHGTQAEILPRSPLRRTNGVAPERHICEASSPHSVHPLAEVVAGLQLCSDFPC